MLTKNDRALREAAKRRAKIVSLYKTGRYSYSEIAARVTPAVTKQWVHKVLRKEGVV